ncbi:MAG: GerMN domain-containing protein, partial [Butyrivibrio sp.]|nr:GerMN domain-containing protein [Butyrivibrio sp.]
PSLLSNSFEDIRAVVAIYSIVNTIAAFADVNTVSLSVDGESSFTYRDFDVSGLYERNLDIIE